MFARALELDELVPDLYLRAGMCHLRCGNLEEAKESLRKSLLLEPRLWPASYLLAHLVADDHRAEGRYLRQARDALSSSPGVLRDDPFLAPFFQGRQAALESIQRRLSKP
jgi:tetratricopeptide (TPR) repeat protein